MARWRGMANAITINALLFSVLAFASHLHDAEQPRDVEQQQVLDDNVHSDFANIAAYLDVEPMAAARPRTGTLQSRSNWTVECDGEQPPFNCSNVLRENDFSVWRSTATAMPHTLTVDMKSVMTVSGVLMLPSRIDPNSQGNIAAHEIYTSLDGKNWTLKAYGTWWGDATEKTSVFEPIQAQFVRLVAKSAALGEKSIDVANFNVFIINNTLPPPLDPKKGTWGSTIDFPIVPAGGWVEPLSGKLVAFSSYGHDRFDDDRGRNPTIQGRTLTAAWNPATKTVSQRIVNETHHDMFCPGMSFDVKGRMIVTGGRSNWQTSIYTPEDQAWVKMSNMTAPRGYQSSVILPDGRMFVLGGSWESIGRSNGRTCEPKNGEIYDPDKNSWTMLPQCAMPPALTAEKSSFDGCNTFRSDNHLWLFPWLNNTVFQAGPSKAMNWYTITGTGGISPAGPRSDDNDAMCGIAVLFDAAQGKILAAGGSLTYANNLARKRAFLINLGDAQPNSSVPTSPAPDMANPRMYHNAVVLPNGQTFVVGGRRSGGIFVDSDAVYDPELYSPATNSWTTMARHSTPRNYHSIALLLPDATVLSGGGGLCARECPVNHFDVQIFTPPYLLTPSGGLATRPVITNISASVVLPGDRLTIGTTDSEIVAASFVRYGSVTHGLNTDQRRVPLALGARGKNLWEVVVPGEAGIVIPGYWMLFVLDAQGVPSVATTVLVKIP